MNARQKLISKMVGATVAVAVGIAGCRYTARKTSELDANRGAAVALDNFALGLNKEAYIDALTANIADNPGEFTEYQDNFTTLAYVIGEAEGFSQEASIYLFDHTSQKVDPDLGLEACSQNVYSRASEQEQLDYLVAQVRETPAENYTTLLIEMGRRVGQNLLDKLR